MEQRISSTLFHFCRIVNLIYRKCEKRITSGKKLDKRELFATVLVTVTFMIVVDRVFDAISLFYWIGDYFALHFVILGIVSALFGIFLSFRTILKAEYRKNLQKGVFFGISASVIFLIYVSFVVGAYHQNVPFHDWLRDWAFRVFLSSLIGCLIGFLLGGSMLQKMPAPQPTVSVVQPTEKEKFSPAKAGAGIVLFLLIGAVMGYFAGYVVWVLFGQIQLALSVFPPYAALSPPPLIYQIGWTVLGALSFPFKILPELF